MTTAIGEHEVKNLLFHESEAKREHRRQLVINNFLFAELDERLDKKPMARQSGGSNLKNSGWNTDWTYEDPTDKINKIADQVGKNAVHFFRSLRGEGPFSTDQVASWIPRRLTLQFTYLRTIIPKNNPRAKANATHAIETLDKMLPGFGQFHQDLTRLSIPLSPFSMTDNYSAENGRVTSDGLNRFIQSEASRPIQLQDGGQIHPGTFYQKHMDRLHNGEDIKVSGRRPSTRVFSMSEVDEVTDASWLVKAIMDKSSNHYQPDFDVMERGLMGLMSAQLKEHGLDAKTTVPREQRQILTLLQYYHKLVMDRMKDWNDPEAIKKLTTFELRSILKSLTVYRGHGAPEVGPDQFRVPKAATLYISNGWDSSPDNPVQKMLTLPPLRQLPLGEVVYDRGNGNMGYDHLVLNWKNGLDKIFANWGENCVQWMKKLQQMPDDGSDISEAWKNISQNRTGAETLLDMLQKFPNWNQFRSNHLTKSLSSEISSVNELRQHTPTTLSFTEDWRREIRPAIDKLNQMAQQDPVAANEELRSLSSELSQMYMRGVMDWDGLTLGLHALNSVARGSKGIIEGNGLTQLRPAEYRDMIDQNGFENLKRYGYQIAKVMDFLSATMVRSCYERVNSRKDGASEDFYGHQYSTSSGKRQGGDVILTVDYEQLDAKAAGDTVEVTEKIMFTLAQRTGNSGDPQILRDDLPWQQMMSIFRERYETGEQFGEMNLKISNSLHQLESAIQAAIQEVSGGVKVVYRNTEGKITELSEAQAIGDSMLAAPGASENPQEQEQQGQNWDWKAPPTPNVPESIVDPQVPQPQDPQATDPQTPQTPQTVTPEQPKTMDEPPISYLSKHKNQKRRLIRDRSIPSLGSIEERLQKAANKLDQHGETGLADKIDRVLQKLCGEENV